MYCTISAAIPTAWPSPIIAWFPLPMARSLFVGAILLTTTNRSCSLCRSMNSCAASYCIFSRRVSCVSAISASWPTGGVLLHCLFASGCSARHKNQNSNNTVTRPPRLYSGVKALWEPSSVDCAPNSGHPKPSLPWHTCSLVLSIACSCLAMTTWTEESNSMKPNTDNNNYSGSLNKPLLCECNLFHSRRLLIKFLESGPSSAHNGRKSGTTSQNGHQEKTQNSMQCVSSRWTRTDNSDLRTRSSAPSLFWDCFLTQATESRVNARS